MNFEPLSREEKIIQKTYIHFAEFAEANSGVDHALLICRHLIDMGYQAIDDSHVTDLLISMDRDYPEEDSMTSAELLWALKNAEYNLAEQLEEFERAWRESNSTRAKLRVINGGLSKNPAIPYVDMTQVVHDYPDF